MMEILSHPAFSIPRLTLWNLSKTLYLARGEKTRSAAEQLRIHEDITIQNIGHFLIELTQRARYERLEDIIDYITGANLLEFEDEYSDEAHTGNQLQITMLDGKCKKYISPYHQYFFGHTEGKEGIAYARHLTHLKKLIDTIRSYKKGKDFLSLKDGLQMLALREKYDLHLTASTLL